MRVSLCGWVLAERFFAFEGAVARATVRYLLQVEP